MEWKLAEAKQQLSEVVRRAASEPQILCNRDRRVAAVISADGLDDYLAWRDRRRSAMKDALDELARICREEGVEYQLEPRRDRQSSLDPFGKPEEEKPRVPRRHKRRL